MSSKLAMSKAPPNTSDILNCSPCEPKDSSVKSKNKIGETVDS